MTNSVSGGCSRMAKIACFLAALTGFAPILGAQSEGPTWSVSPFGGYQWGKQTGTANLFPITREAGNTAGGQSFGEGAVAGIRVSQEYHNYFGLEEGFTWARLPAIFSAYGTGANITLNSDVYRASLNPVLHFTRRTARIRPFVTAGVSANWFVPRRDTLLTAQPRDIGFGQGVFTKVEPAFLYGVGVKLNMSHKFGIRFDVRDHWGREPHFGMPDFPPGGSGAWYSPKGQDLHQVELTMGLVFRFGDREPPRRRRRRRRPTAATASSAASSAVRAHERDGEQHEPLPGSGGGIARRGQRRSRPTQLIGGRLTERRSRQPSDRQRFQPRGLAAIRKLRWRSRAAG